MKRSALVIALLGSLVFACAGSDGNNTSDTSQDPAAASAQEQDLKAKRCGAFLDGECPAGYWCDMSNIPPGNVGGSGVCKKEHHCILNGVMICPKGQTFDPAVCHCH